MDTDNCHVKCHCGQDGKSCAELYNLPFGIHAFTPYGDELLPCNCGYRSV